jgi:hypothetical protein
VTKVRNGIVGLAVLILALVVIVPHLDTAKKDDHSQVVYTWTYGNIKPRDIQYFDDNEHHVNVLGSSLPDKRFSVAVPFRAGKTYFTQGWMNYHGELSGVTLSCQVTIRGIPQQPRSLAGVWGNVHCGPYGPF